jgi:PAS domain S-box-containing protein
MFHSLVKPSLLGLLRFILLMVLIWGLSAPALAQAQPQSRSAVKNVLVLYSEEESHPAHELTGRGIRSTFNSNKLFKVRLYNEYLDRSRFKDPAITHAFANYLRRKYAGLKIDVIIAVYNTVVDFLLKEDVFPKTPIVAQVSGFYAENLEHSPWRRSITGTIIEDNITGFLVAAFQMMPSTKRVALVGGTNPIDINTEQLFRKALEPYREKIEIVDLTRLPMREILSRVGSLPPDTIVLFSNIFTDGAGQNFVPREALALISRAANAPVFGRYDSYLGYGIVGGRLVSFEEHGKEAAALALRIMGGESPASIPFSGERGYVSAYDWRQLRRWNLSEAALPKGSIIINKKTTFWDYKYFIFGILAFCLLEAALIIFLFVQRRRKIVAEGNLQTSEERFRQFFKNIPDYCYIISAEGNILHINEAALKTLGYKREELIGKPLATIYAPESWSKMKALFDQWKKEGEIKNEEVVILTKNGERRTVLLNVGTVRDADGKIIHSASIQTDITGWQQDQMKIEKQRQELIHVSRVGALGQLASSLAHEINQPLAAILSNAQAAQRFLGQKKPNLEELRDIFKDIIDDNERAGEVIRKIRSLIKKKEFEFKKQDINDLVRETSELLAAYARRRNKSIRIQPDPDLPFLDGDRVQLQQVLLNLITNGIDAMVERGPAAQELVIRTSKNDSNAVVIAIKDSGSGLPDKDPNCVFEPFYTTKPEGLGMGLVISRSIVEGHGGTLHAENNPDKGATFFVTIPVEAAKRT